MCVLQVRPTKINPFCQLVCVIPYTRFVRYFFRFMILAIESNIINLKNLERQVLISKRTVLLKKRQPVKYILFI